MQARVFDTPLGWVGVAASEAGVTKVVLPQRTRSRVIKELGGSGALVNAADDNLGLLQADLNDYLLGQDVDFTGYELDWRQASGFQSNVWAAARGIGYGRVETYGQLAGRIGCPTSARAVGGALNRNLTPILVPCHRVVSAGGIGGFAYGKKLKGLLLRLEGNR